MLEELLASCKSVASNPRESLDRYLSDGRKAIGVGPYYLPEELVDAAGAVPFGVWGCMGTAVEAKKYFPPFYCSICQMSLEMGLTNKLRGLSGMMISGLCDTLKAFSQNWKAGVSSAIPMVYVYQPQNRFGDAGKTFAYKSYQQARKEIGECLGTIIEDESIKESLRLYNEWRAAMRSFIKLAGTHPAEISASDRAAVIESGYYQSKRDHLKTVKAINECLSSMPESVEGYKKVFLTGIFENIPEILAMFDEGKYAIVGDDLARESRAFAVQIDESEDDPVRALANAFCSAGSDPILFDPNKDHVASLKEAVKESGAEGVISLRAKFCDPEEFEHPFVSKACEELGVHLVTIEIDQMTESYGQASTQLEAFNDMIG